ncbi:ATP-binding protein [Negadavirga shengliensis]|uniref:histidine kinase n=1 Tax=Negadavirga shengliensis TaxID=1389218 RepID=A0ABV9T7B8_9BACT
MAFNARVKVIIGFFLAVCLTVGVSAVTYFSVRKLLDSVESLSEPNEKLRELNYLLADIYQLDKSRVLFLEGDTTENVDYFSRIQERLSKLEALSADTSEVQQIKKIGYSVNELLVVYRGLEDVKNNLLSRNFTREALNNIERKIRRKEELSRLQSLGKIRINPASTNNNNRSPEPANRDSVPNSAPNTEAPRNLFSGAEKVEMERLLTKLRLNLNRVGNETCSQFSDSDSIIYAVRQMVLDINYEERSLRSRLGALEQELTNKNKELIISIQDIVTSLQNEALMASKSENESAYELTYKLSLLLGMLIIVGVIGSTGFIFSIIKEIKKSETFQKQLTEAKQRSDKLAKAKQDFLASMSHEIRNPLHVIQGYNEALEKTPLNRDQEEYVRMVNFASDTLLGIVNDILDFSKLEAGKIKIENAPFNPLRLFKDIQQFFDHKAAEKGLVLEMDISVPDQKWLVGDELRINQILNNLISNAIKFTEKGKVRVLVKYEEEDRLIIEVEDTGMGMTAEMQKTLFREFNQGDGSISRRFGGTGLGLAIVKKLVDLQRGEILVESELGEGTQMSVSLPTELVDAGELQPELDPRRYTMDGLKVLLVDDDPVGLKFSELLIKNLGAKVSSYTGGVDFQGNFRKEAFDLALIDVQMPEVDGYQVLKQLRQMEQYKKVPIFAMTANVFAKEREKMEEEGFDGLILKPFKEKELVAKLLQYIPLNDTGNIVITEPACPGENQKYDLSGIKKFCMGDETLFKEVLEDFYTQTGSDLLSMNRALGMEDYRQIREIAHQLSSRLGQLKISESRLAKELEIDLKNGRTDEIEEKIWILTEQVNNLLEEISRELGLSVSA